MFEKVHPEILIDELTMEVFEYSERSPRAKADPLVWMDVNEL